MKYNYTLDTDAAKKLATQVAKQSTGISVKIGETNGKAVLHLVNRLMPGKIASQNVVNEADWAEHPWNKQNQKKKAKEADNTNE